MQKIQKWFTLIELTVTMAIIMILAVGASSINFNTATDREFLNSLTNKIASSIEKHRNNALIGRWIWPTLEIPISYQINFSTASSGSMNILYSTGASFINLESISLQNFESISQIRCYTPTFSSSGTSSNTTLILEKNNLSLSGCTAWWNTGSVLEITAKYKASSKKIMINTLTGRVEKK